MFGQPSKTSIDTLIGASTCVQGDVRVKGGLRIDGRIIGDVIAEPDVKGLLIVSESARIEGAVRGAHVVINGEVVGPVHSTELLELQPKARITGDVTYKALEMHGGAVVQGQLIPHQTPDTVLKLTAANT